ncbi:MAG: ParB/RepB/Spo0J family partition protein [Desulfobacterales bacterium]|nr:ParB/RepB/Spo0J family partition protein [Desulfobacterales bacterium]
MGKNISFQLIDIDKLTPYENATKMFDDYTEEEMTQMVESIKNKEVIEPIIITQDYVIICGHQRYNASKKLGLKEIPAIIREVKDQIELEQIMCHENLNRRHLSILGMAKVVKRLYDIYEIDRKGGKHNNQFSREYICRELNMDEVTLSRYRTIADVKVEIGHFLKEMGTHLLVYYQFGQLDQESQEFIYNQIKEKDEQDVKALLIESVIKNYKEELNQHKNKITDLEADLEKNSKLNNDDEVQKLKDAIQTLKANRPQIQLPNKDKKINKKKQTKEAEQPSTTIEQQRKTSEVQGDEERANDSLNLSENNKQAEQPSTAIEQQRKPSEVQGDEERENNSLHLTENNKQAEQPSTTIEQQRKPSEVQGDEEISKHSLKTNIETLKIYIRDSLKIMKGSLSSNQFSHLKYELTRIINGYNIPNGFKNTPKKRQLKKRKDAIQQRKKVRKINVNAG